MNTERAWGKETTLRYWRILLGNLGLTMALRNNESSNVEEFSSQNISGESISIAYIIKDVPETTT
jgi:hypothetical protein